MQGMETPSQAPVTSVVSFSVGALLPRQCFTYPESFQAHLLAPLLSILILGSGLGCVHPGLLIWALDTVLYVPEMGFFCKSAFWLLICCGN